MKNKKYYSVCTEKEKKCRFLVPANNKCDYIHPCEFKKLTYNEYKELKR